MPLHQIQEALGRPVKPVTIGSGRQGVLLMTCRSKLEAESLCREGMVRRKNQIFLKVTPDAVP